MKRSFLALVLATLSALPALAGGRGGHNTTFDPNSYGGGWTCFRSQASGACGASAFAQYFDAACDGVVSDNVAAAAWVTYGISQGASQAKLYIPSGSRCTGSFSLGWNGVLGDPGVQNYIVWMYGARLSNSAFGSENFPQTAAAGVSKVQTVSAAATTVTLVTGSEISRFSVGDWVCLGALELQTGGYPPTFQFFEYHLITGINGSAITFNSPVVSARFLSTYPNPDPIAYGGIGPAVIMKMPPSWNANSTFFGGTLTTVGAFGLAGRDMMIYDAVWTGQGPSPSAHINAWFFGGYYGTGAEIDKEVDNITFFRGSASGLNIQSVSVNNFTLDGVALSNLAGTPLNAVINNSRISGRTILGPNSYGHGQSITASGSVIASAESSNKALADATSNMTYSSGTFTTPLADAIHVLEWAVPGQKYYTGWYDGSPHNCSPLMVFTITAVRQVSTDIIFDTDIVGSRPAPDCSGSPLLYFAYPAATITQKFTGPANLTQFAAPP